MDFSEFLAYSPDTGIIYWIKKTNHSVIIGLEAGTRRKDGYRSLKFQGKRYLSHRVAWYLTYGKWPDNVIDHINGICDDNRLVNLRDVTQLENNLNKHKGHGYKFLVYWNKELKQWVKRK